MYSQDCLVYGVVRHSFHVLRKKEFQEHSRKNVVFAALTVPYMEASRFFIAFNRGIFLALYSTLFRLPSLRFHWAGECWDWTQDCCDQWRSILIDWRPFRFSVFLLVRETWSTRAAEIQNTETKRPEYCPDCHFVQNILRKNAGEHVLYCDGSLKGLAIPRTWMKMLSCKLLSTAAAFVIYKFVMLITIAKLCQNSG